MNTTSAHSPRRRTKWRRIAVSVAVVAGTLALPLADSTASAACRKWAFIGVPGSGQGKTHFPSGTNDTALYGKEVAQVKAAFVTKVGAGNVALYPIKYPAYNAGKDAWLGFTGPIGVAVIGSRYVSSVNAGIAETKRIINSVSQSCPNTKFVMAGYSQGAQVVASALGSFPVAASKMHRAALMGNPMFADGSPNSVEVGSVTRSGIFNLGSTWQARWHGKARDVCIDKDLFCEVASAANFTAHEAYTTRNYPGSTVKIGTSLGTWLGG